MIVCIKCIYMRHPPYLARLGEFPRMGTCEDVVYVWGGEDGIQLTTEGMAFHLPAILDRRWQRCRAGGLHVTIDGMAHRTWASG